MATPFIAEIRLFGFAFAPRRWAFCQGQILSISQNQALFSLLGTTYGGDGRTTFALPDLRGRAPLHWGAGPGLSSIGIGQAGGTTAHLLTAAQMPAHTHTPQASTAAADQPAVSGNTWAATPTNHYAPPTSPVALAPNAIGAAGGSQAHANEQPYLVMNYCIALQGVFPSRT